MKFLIAIHKDPGSSYGVTVPDFPGCHSAGATVEQAIENTLEAIEGWVETSVEAGDEVRFEPTPFERLRDNPDYAGAFWAVVDVDPARFDVKPERINISMPRFVLAQIDTYAEAHNETRSGFLVRAALEKMRESETPT
ncbi:type II toxin-antitoxin system HicB family antitoxin [Burkholderia stagnalis]|uniref:type II toxin-antitoxin system HicB family antitoxin n=1 Tax=Burkholderia stagnalis TaxID=1503054 RepID=UPI000F5B4AB0|nr:type II toxin-antitoxin system HicB family antitoxin [Burkholderia stagnalis]RQQ25991.1 type II toxin-antitoxin system HicB family antitoxin [Burkholderia stagnalis]RQY48857.1 type II toxin-antitoxin system HicB family antitoxin [Burkholderia stagnalis]